MAKIHGAVREKRKSYTLVNGSKALLECQNKILKHKDMFYLCNFELSKIM